MSYALDRWLWDIDASGYHFTSLLLHAIGALLVLALAWRLLRLWGSPWPPAHRSGSSATAPPGVPFTPVGTSLPRPRRGRCRLAMARRGSGGS